MVLRLGGGGSDRVNNNKNPTNHPIFTVTGDIGCFERIRSEHRMVELKLPAKASGLLLY